MKEDISTHFDDRASSFEATPWVKNPIINSLYNTLLPNNFGQFILDAGGGTGTLIEFLRQSHNDTHFVCVDISYEMLRQACLKNIPSILADISRLPFESSSFNHIIMRQVLHYLDKPSLAIRECGRIVQHGGKFLVGQFVPFSKEDKEWMWEIAGLRQPLRKNFLSVDEIIDLLDMERFYPISVREVTVVESLTSWLKKYTMGEYEEYKIWDKFKDALKNGCPRHIESRGSDIFFENRFALVVGTR
jgi:ubiquinone/menaquinone biosynthesis C-methylase UbiE